MKEIKYFYDVTYGFNKNKIEREKIKFVRFLKERGIFIKYIHNLKNGPFYLKTYNGDFNFFINKCCFNETDSKYSMIDRAFVWRETKEGHNFWSAFNQYWKNIDFYRLHNNENL